MRSFLESAQLKAKIEVNLRSNVCILLVITYVLCFHFSRFVEIGSITPEPQPGNPKPRMFRLTEDKGVINRYGFNSEGLDKVEDNVKSFCQYRSSKTAPEKSNILDWWSLDAFRQNICDLALYLIWAQDHTVAQQGILGINLGKNKHSTDETADYEKGIAQLGPYADYLVVNISSPNTPGLRALQKREPIRRLLKAAIRARDNISPLMRVDGIRGGNVDGRDIPLFVKIAPDISSEEMEDIAAAVIEIGVDGMVISNTSNQRPSGLLSKASGEEGGLSGAPIKDMSTECIRKMYHLTNGEIPIIGVGGVGSGHDAYEKLKAGASLVQIYSMLVYEGPGLVSRVRRELAEIMLENGQRKVEDVIGIDHEEIYWRRREDRSRNERTQEKIIVDE
uniref:Dihydroorotate dehydrogenase (quinone), mitochondrial n=1 Tax=Ditylum brightwellii TaxID=49249 RepID=A0A7S4QHV6_9STRA|mmetsp:Transcript_5033/g.6650  ORF Transcript_5033/g.6650 Transcript_5033/m.6650 type:complete len:392 (+) Transcript_5033:784-1959(+)